MSRAKLGIVIPIYNEEENLSELRRRLTPVLDGLSELDAFVIYVNDGSRDQSLEMMTDQHQQDRRFTIVDFSRNFGHQAAITAGLAQAGALDVDACVIMDGDLQDPPEVIPSIVEAWRAGGEVVQAVRRSRQERGIRRVGLELFHLLFQWISDFPISANTGVFGLLDRRALRELNRLPERNRFLPGLRAWIGFTQRSILYDRHERAAGEPKLSLMRLARYAIDGVMSFSYKPLRLLLWMGIWICLSGFGLSVWFVGKRLLGYESAVTGFTTTITVILFLGGVQLVAIGLLGEYLRRIYDEVKQRPLYIMRHHIGGPE